MGIPLPLEALSLYYPGGEVFTPTFQDPLMQGAVVHGRWRGSGPGYCEGLGLTAIPGEDPPAVTYDIDVETRCSVHKTALVTRGVMLNPTKEELDVAKTIVSVFANSGKGKVLLNTGNAM